MKKAIQIEKSGHIWRVDMEFVASHRAKHYADKDSDTTYQEEFDYVMGDDYEAIDWYQNNMDWSDIPDDNKRLVSAPVINSPDDIDDEYGSTEIVDVKQVEAA